MPGLPMLGSAIVVALVAAWAFGAVAAPPDPFRTVPTDRSAQTGVGTDRVFGGAPVPDGRYPFQVALLKAAGLSPDPASQYEAQFCGGTLIAPKWVLTAAHCLRDEGKTIAANDFVVLTGSTDLEAGKRLHVKAVIVNEHYDENSMDHDAALIELLEPATAAPIALDTGNAGASHATVVGWGMDEDGDYPRQLLATDLDVVANEECNIAIKAIYAKALKSSIADLASQYRIRSDAGDRIGDELAQNLADPLTPTMLCAGLKSGKRDSCYGDSGGPLLVERNGQPIQLGIVSWGEGPADSEIKCGHQDVYGVYSRVASFKDWLQTTMAGG